MKSGFLISNNPKVSVFSEKPKESDKTLGHRKYKYEDFEFERNIGTGNFSQVWHATLKSDPLAYYAIKSYNIMDVTSKNQVNFVKQEREAMLSLNSPGHKNVIRMIDTFRDDSSVYLIYEFAEGGELWELIKHCGSILDEIAVNFVLQVLDGLEYIHSKGLVHRDLKCENIVISGGTLKIIDFGTSRYSSRPQSTDSSESVPDKSYEQPTRSGSRLRRFEHYVGTPNFMDPQSLSNTDTGFKRDFWSLGCLLYQILCGRPPFYGSTEYFIMKRVKEMDLVFPPTINPQARDLITSLLNPDPDQRPGLSEVRSHPFLKAQTDSFSFTDFESFQNSREVCYKIGKVLLQLFRLRSPELTEDLRTRFEGLISDLRDQINENNSHVMNRLIDLMFWSLEQTKSEIFKEIAEADRWLS